MKQRPAELLLYPMALAGLAAFLYALNWRNESTTMLREIRATLKQNGNQAHQASELLNKQKQAIDQIHHSRPSQKGPQNPHPKSRKIIAGSTRSGRN